MLYNVLLYYYYQLIPVAMHVSDDCYIVHMWLFCGRSGLVLSTIIYYIHCRSAWRGMAAD